jgi:Ca2+-binding EF-hand superfamily protein
VIQQRDRNSSEILITLQTSYNLHLLLSSFIGQTIDSSLVFQKYDADGSGALDAKELEGVLKFIGQGATTEEAQRLLNLVDSDNSGFLEFGEFLDVRIPLLISDVNTIRIGDSFRFY